ncbi:MAG: molecular chaperone TorD family protein, partial [bacterium]
SAEEWAERCTDEFLLLFVGPGVPRLTPCESHYRAGRAYGPPLGAVREFMGRAGLEPVNESHEPEDHIAFEFQILRLLIEKQAEGKDPDEEAEWLGRQGEFVRGHLGLWAPKFFQDTIEDENTVFFEAFAKIGMGYVAWESEMLEDWGPRPDEKELLKIQTDRPWKGPLFDADAPNPELIEEGPEEPPLDDEDPLMEGDLRKGN